MASKFVRPLWKQKIPKLPQYFKGDPQRQILLPFYWMKIVKPKDVIPDDMVHFQIHPQMSKADVKQYLEKIYKVDVLSVRTEIRQGKNVVPTTAAQQRARYDDEKFAYVQLLNERFRYPDIQLDTSHKKREERSKKIRDKMETSDFKKTQAIPRWFR